MIKPVLSFYSLLPDDFRRKIIIMQFFIIVLALMELIGVASVLPFMAVVSNPEIVQQNELLRRAYEYFNFTNTRDFLFLLGSGVFISVLISNSIGLFTNRAVIQFGFLLGRNVATNLFAHLLGKEYLYHIYNNSSILTNKVIKQVDRAIMGVIIPFLQFNSRLFIVLFISVGLLVINPVLTFLTGFILTIFYLSIFYVVRKTLEKNGKRITEAARDTFQTINEGFSGVKEIKFLGKEGEYVSRYDKFASEYADAATVNQFVPIVPRFLIEVLAFGAVVLSILFFLSRGDGVNEFLPLLSIFAAGGLKLMPALQQVFAAVATLKGNMDALDDIMEDYPEKTYDSQRSNFDKKIDFNNEITLDSISFKYPGTESNVLDDLTLSIRKNSSVAFVGSSGAGKTTLVDILLGLLKVDSGKLLVDGVEISEHNLCEFQNSMGYVPQSIFLADTTIRENIALGVSLEKIDEEMIQKAVQMAHLEEFTKTLSKGLNTFVGERGIQLSGGQRQRIGIARALYKNPDILIFDEATSALDGITEDSVMKEIENLSGIKTIIIIAHRLTTIRNSDNIFVLGDGRVISSGSYEQLKSKVDLFQIADN